MRVAIDISGQFGKMTGIQHHVDGLLNALFTVSTPHEIAAFAPGLASEAWRDLEQNSLFDWWRVPGARVDRTGDDVLWRTPARLRSSPFLYQIADRIGTRLAASYNGRTRSSRVNGAAQRYDLFHVPEPYDLRCLQYPVRRSVVTIHDMTTVTRPSTHIPGTLAIWAKFFDYAKRRAARILTVSEFSKADIVEHLGIPADRVDVTPNAARASTEQITDGATISRVLEDLGLADTPFVLYSGTLEPRKNLFRLVEAFARAVADARLPDCKLVLAGGNWNRHDLEVRLHAWEHGVGNRVVTTGYVSNAEMNALMSSCAAFAYVSEYEGFGMPPLEAMVCGAPVVASNTTSLPEVVGDAGIQVDPADVGAIAGALHLLLTDGAENARRRALSLARAKEFSWERTARLTLQSYEAAVL